MWEKIKPNFSNVKEGKEYKTCINDEQGIRNIGTLVRSNNLWFAGGTYIYYTPTHIWV